MGGGGSPQQHIAQQNCRVEDFVKGADTLRDIKLNVVIFLDGFYALVSAVDYDNSTQQVDPGFPGKKHSPLGNVAILYLSEI